MFEKFGVNKSIMGHVGENVACLCMTEKATQDYLYNAIYDLVKAVNDNLDKLKKGEKELANTKGETFEQMTQIFKYFFVNIRIFCNFAADFFISD